MPPSSQPPPAAVADSDSITPRKDIRLKIKALAQAPLKWSMGTWLRILLLTAILISVIILFTVVRIDKHMPDIIQFVKRKKAAGFFIYCGLSTLLSMVGVPLSVVAVGAGYLFKPIWYAFGQLLLVALFGSVLSFLGGRYVFRESLMRTRFATQNRTFVILRRAVRVEGWKIVLMLRLSQVIPFTVANYSLALTEIGVFSFAWASTVGVFPGMAFFCYLGTLLTDLSDLDRVLKLDAKRYWTMMIVTICSVIVVLVFVTVIARRAWRDTVRKMALRDQMQASQDALAASSSDSEVGDESALLRRVKTAPIHSSTSQSTDDLLFGARDSHPSTTTNHGRPLTAPAPSRAPITVINGGITSSLPTINDAETKDVGRKGSKVALVIEDESVDLDRMSEPFTRNEKLAMILSVVAALLTLSIALPVIYTR